MGAFRVACRRPERIQLVAVGLDICREAQASSSVRQCDSMVIRTLNWLVSKKHPDIVGDNSLGRSRSGFGTKIHLATDGNGLLLNIVLGSGQAHKSQFALRLLDAIGVQR